MQHCVSLSRCHACSLRIGPPCSITGLDSQVKVWDVRTYKPLHAYFAYRPATSLDISQRGLLMVGYGRKAQVSGGVRPSPPPCVCPCVCTYGCTGMVHIRNAQLWLASCLLVEVSLVWIWTMHATTRCSLLASTCSSLCIATSVHARTNVSTYSLCA